MNGGQGGKRETFVFWGLTLSFLAFSFQSNLISLFSFMYLFCRTCQRAEYGMLSKLVLLKKGCIQVFLN